MIAKRSREAVYQVTEWGDPRSVVQTMFSWMDYDLWCQAEAYRFKDNGRQAWLEINEKGEIAVFSWAGCYLPVDDNDPKF